MCFTKAIGIGARRAGTTEFIERSHDGSTSACRRESGVPTLILQGRA